MSAQSEGRCFEIGLFCPLKGDSPEGEMIFDSLDRFYEGFIKRLDSDSKICFGLHGPKQSAKD